MTDLGCVTLDPNQALAYVRSRHYEQLIDGEWETDPTSDLGRIDRQQDFIQRALSRAIDKGARNPATLDRLINVGLDGITVDDSLTADDIFRLGNRFRNFEPTDLLTYSVPVEGDTVGAARSCACRRRRPSRSSRCSGASGPAPSWRPGRAWATTTTATAATGAGQSDPAEAGPWSTRRR